MKTEGNMILIFVSIELKLEILLVQDITHRKTEEESSLLLKEGHDSARSGKLYAGNHSGSRSFPWTCGDSGQLMYLSPAN